MHRCFLLTYLILNLVIFACIEKPQKLLTISVTERNGGSRQNKEAKKGNLIKTHSPSCWWPHRRAVVCCRTAHRPVLALHLRLRWPSRRFDFRWVPVWVELSTVFRFRCPGKRPCATDSGRCSQPAPSVRCRRSWTKAHRAKVSNRSVWRSPRRSSVCCRPSVGGERERTERLINGTLQTIVFSWIGGSFRLQILWPYDVVRKYVRKYREFQKLSFY